MFPFQISPSPKNKFIGTLAQNAPSAVPPGVRTPSPLPKPNMVSYNPGLQKPNVVNHNPGLPQPKVVNALSQTPAATAPQPSPSPARSAFVESLQNDLSGINAAANTSSSDTSSTQSFTQSSPGPNYSNSYQDAFKSYIDSLKPSEDEESAAKRVSDLNLQAMRDQEKALGMGETLGFATGEAARVNRENSFQQMAAADALEALTGRRSATSDAAKARVEFEKSLLPKPEEAFTLGKDQVRYDAKGNPIARGPSESTAAGAYTAGANPTVDAYVKMVQSGSLKLDGVPQEIRGAVAQGLAAAPKADDPKTKYVKSQADEAITNIDKALALLQDPNSARASENRLLRSIPGASIVSSSVADLNSALNTVKALVGFDALQKMREASPTGGALGQITERELAFLQSVQGSLDTIQSNEQLIATIGRVRQSFQTLQIVNSPDGSEFELNGQKYRKEGNQMIPVSFSSAGNASASNRPQRNNNPLNIKMSAATSTYPGVVGADPSPATDGGKFLKFATPEDGFNAAKTLIQSSGYKNLTVDAALKRWSNKGYGGEIVPSIANKTVAQLTSAELDSLIKTMAKREGYYA